MKKLMIIALAAMMVAPLFNSCKEESSIDKIASDVKEGADKAADEAKKAADKGADAVKAAADKAAEATK
ncbi:MAG: hypothetical protein J6X55_07120 [Victivallales bacterium]|nr:hypothetical protein [Victivallales bacterium]